MNNLQQEPALDDVIQFINDNNTNIADRLFSDKNPYLHTETGKAVLAYYGVRTQGYRNDALEQWVKTYEPDIEKDSLRQVLNKVSYYQTNTCLIIK